MAPLVSRAEMEVEYRRALFLHQPGSHQPGLRKPGLHPAGQFLLGTQNSQLGRIGLNGPRLPYPARRYVLHKPILRVILRSAGTCGADHLDSTFNSPGEVNFGTQGPNAGEARGCRVASHRPAVNVH